MKKVLVSRGFGAGWSSWNDKAQAVAEYQPIIDYIEAGGTILSGLEKPYIPNDKWADSTFDEREAHLHPDFRALVKQMMTDLEMDYFYTGGADGLTVETVSGPYRIDDYDGAESIISIDDLWDS